MSTAVVTELLKTLDIVHPPIASLPCAVSLSEKFNLAVFITQFGEISFSVMINRDVVLPWNDFEVVEFFMDDETQFFLKRHLVSMSESKTTLGLSKCVHPEKVQIFELANLVEASTSQLNRFLIEFTAVA